MRPFLLAFTVIGSITLSGPVTAQNYPVRPVRVIVPFAAGGGLDIVLRPLFQKMSENVQQNFILDFRPGANGIIGTEIGAKAPPDGYTPSPLPRARSRSIRTSMRNCHSTWRATSRRSPKSATLRS